MKRDIEKKLYDWKNSARRKPLILQGARQVGKTYTLKEFITTMFSTMKKSREISFNNLKFSISEAPMRRQ